MPEFKSHGLDLFIDGKKVIKAYESWNGLYWFATEESHKQDSIIEGKVYPNDTIFFGFVQGHEEEWGYFSKAEIETPDEVFRHLQNAYTYIHSGQNITPAQKNVLEIVESMGMTLNRAKTLMAIQDIKQEVRAYILRRNATSEGGRGDFAMDKIYQLSFIPQKHQMKVARAFVHVRFADIKLAYKQWLNGLRDDEFKIKNLRKGNDMAAVNAAMERRDRVIANLKESTGTKFTLGAFIMDIHMLQDSIKLAKTCKEKEGLEITSRARELIFETVEMLNDLSKTFALSQNDTKGDKKAS